MRQNPGTIVVLFLFVGSMLLSASGCAAPQPPAPTPSRAAATPAPLPTQAPSPEPTLAPTAVVLPEITTVELDRPELPRYELLELKLAVKAEYSNPYDLREVSLEGTFTGPDGKAMTAPGFWDGEEAWRLRFTPSLAGLWSYALVVKDHHGASHPAEGKFTVTASDLHGWLQNAQTVNPNFSPHYLAYQDGTPFYGIGHCDAFTILADGFTLNRGMGLFNTMNTVGENYVVWWPFYTSSPVATSYNQYSTANMKIIDLVVREAQKKNIALIFTIWDHPELRAQGHAWGSGRWEGANGFHLLGDIQSFFVSPDAWAWQENLYHYIIARWGYSPAIGMWQTVSEINGTNSYDQTDPWHTKVNDYFVKNDPYRHPTTASMSGDVDWLEGHKVMDAPQVHVYDLDHDPVKAASTMAMWTGQMWNQAEKPNWIGEFGVAGNTEYPEMFHNSIWAALASGAAMTPAEWNDNSSWMRMSTDMYADMTRLAQFVAAVPLARLNPAPLQITSGTDGIRAWGVAGQEGGLAWVQDFSLEGKTTAEVRKNTTLRRNVTVEIQGLVAGTYTIRPYDTWQGKYLKAFDVPCAAGTTCKVSLPNFKADLAFQMMRK